MDIRRIVEDNDTKCGRVFDYTIQFLIIVSIVSFSIETLPDLDETAKEYLSNIELLCVVLFTL
ncbi:MAG: ion transporter, partial [Gammaproteobacteria bacterium]|nr:ion transporter [Gammaproteobacteria bacterium]